MTFRPAQVRRSGSGYEARITFGADCAITAFGLTEEEARQNVRTLVDVFERGGHPAARREAERIIAAGGGAR